MNALFSGIKGAQTPPGGGGGAHNRDLLIIMHASYNVPHTNKDT